MPKTEGQLFLARFPQIGPGVRRGLNGIEALLNFVDRLLHGFNVLGGGRVGSLVDFAQQVRRRKRQLLGGARERVHTQTPCLPVGVSTTRPQGTTNSTAPS